MNAAQERPRAWTDVSALMALCAGLRLAYVWLVPRVLDSADAVAYLETARRMAAGDLAAIDPKIPLLYPALVALAHGLIPDIESAGRAVSWVCSTLLVVPVYFLARELHGRASARIAGVLIACWPWLIDYGSRVATEPLAVLLFVSGVFALVRGWDHGVSVQWMSLAGVALGLLHLTRAEGTFVYLGAFGALFVLGLHRGDRSLLRVTAFVLPGIASLIVGAVAIHAIADVWTLNYRVGFIGDPPEGSTVARDFARTLVAMSADVPAVMLGPLLWTFFGVGVFAPGERRRDAQVESGVLYFAALQWLVVLPVLSPAPRYLMSAFVLLAVWSARGIERSGALLARRSRAVASLPLAAVVAWMLFHASASVVSESTETDPPRQPWEFKHAGEWMRDHLEPGAILTRKPQVGFYAELPTVGPEASATLDDLYRLIAENEIRYVVIDERYTANLVPAMKPLLEPGNAPEFLEHISDYRAPYPAARVVIYRTK